MKKYSEEQVKAITTNTNHAAVIAGAGSGKTTVLIERINNIIENGGNPDKILAITFTKKAALEMSERIRRKDLTIKTFDAFCYEVVSNYSDIKIDIISKTPFKEAELVKFNNYDVSLKKGDKPSDYDSYVNFKSENGKMDFNDVEYIALDLIKENNIKYDYILIDEFQDTNELQYLIFENLIGKNTKSFIVGDPDQSIYGFRGANVSLLNKYIDEISTETYILSNNYRSKKLIIESANNLISHNKVRIDKTLKAYNEKDGLFYMNNFLDDYMEFTFVTKKYEELSEKYETFAILYRNNYQGYLYRNYFKEEEHPNVLVTTIHQSKGLEFDVVFIIGVNEGVIPDSKMNKALEVEEERRLFFVGITRAKKELYLTSSKRSNYNGISKHQKESMFLKETKINQSIFNAFKKIKKETNDITFEVDDIIMHDKFGEGKVMSVDKKFLVINFFADYEDRKISLKYKGIRKK